MGPNAFKKETIQQNRYIIVSVNEVETLPVLLLCCSDPVIGNMRSCRFVKERRTASSVTLRRQRKSWYCKKWKADYLRWLGLSTIFLLERRRLLLSYRCFWNAYNILIRNWLQVKPFKFWRPFSLYCLYYVVVLETKYQCYRLYIFMPFTWDKLLCRLHYLMMALV